MIPAPEKSQGVPLCDVLVHGSGECDQLGLGEGVLERKKPTLLKSLRNVISVSVGSLHNLALTSDGQVYSWGCNDEGALGRSGEENVPLPIPAFANVPIKLVRVGDCHSAFVDCAGRLWLCGSYKDSSGHLGFPDYAKGIGHTVHKQLEPVLVQGLPPKMKVDDVVCGANHTVVLLSPSDDRRRSSLTSPAMALRVMSWGNDEFGQLGLGSSRDDEEGRKEEDTVMLKHTSRGKRHVKNKLFPRDIAWSSRTGGGIAAVFATAQCSFVKTTDNALYGCGLNNFGQIGFGSTSVYPVRALTKVDPLSSTTNGAVMYVSGGTVHSAARTRDGHVLAWGRRDYSGLPASKDMGDIQPPTIVKGLEAVTAISCGGSHTLACTGSGQVFAWGFGGTHQLGNLPRDISQGAAGPDEEPQDEQEPYLIQSKQIGERFVVSVAAGAQHSVELAWTGQYAEDTAESLEERAAVALLTPSKRRSGMILGSAKKRRVAGDEE